MCIRDRSGTTAKNATSFVENSDKLGDSRTNVSSVQRKRVTKGDRKTLANPTNEFSHLTVASKKKYMAGTASFNNQVRERTKAMNSTISTPRGSSSLLKSISMTKLSRPRAAVVPSSNAVAADSLTMDKNRS